jgi:phosphinothricin acetyltransferase
MIAVAAMRADHWPDVVRIYAEGIATGDATFETEVPSWERWDASHLREHRYVAVCDGDVVGWAAVSPVSGRAVYAGVVEVSVYVAEPVRGKGIGTLLLDRLACSTGEAGIWTIQAGVFPENEASVRAHERAGFRVVGRRERVARLNGAWRDVLLLERRSDAVD